MLENIADKRVQLSDASDVTPADGDRCSCSRRDQRSPQAFRRSKGPSTAMQGMNLLVNGDSDQEGPACCRGFVEKREEADKVCVALISLCPGQADCSGDDLGIRVPLAG
jgi:hypothetical protein